MGGYQENIMTGPPTEGAEVSLAGSTIKSSRKEVMELEEMEQGCRVP